MSVLQWVYDAVENTYSWLKINNNGMKLHAVISMEFSPAITLRNFVYFIILNDRLFRDDPD